MTVIDRDAPVMVTGATGYVAGSLMEELLKQGHTIHAPVRQPDSTEKLKYLNALAEQHPGTIKYFKADLLDEGSYAQAMEGCQLVYHTASPFTVEVTDPQKELVDPALKGTRNVLEQANKTESVKRVVLTSSVAAIYGDNADLANAKGPKFSEQDWNTSSSLEHQPYSYSKTVAEQEAWKIAKSQSRWDLVVINPSFVIGPGINPHATSESFHLIQQLGDGTMKTGIPKWPIGIVDVRDVATAHVNAGYTPDAQGRHIVSGYDSSFSDMAKILVAKYGKTYPLPKIILPKWMVWLFGPIINSSMTRKMISLNVNLPYQSDNSKGKEKLGLQYRPLESSVIEFFEQAINSGLIKKR